MYFCTPNAQTWPKYGPNAAQMWPEYEILQPKMNPWKFSVARARPEPKPQARNPTRTMKKVARPSPTRYSAVWFYLVNQPKPHVSHIDLLIKVKIF